MNINEKFIANWFRRTVIKKYFRCELTIQCPFLDHCIVHAVINLNVGSLNQCVNVVYLLHVSQADLLQVFLLPDVKRLFINLGVLRDKDQWH